MGHHPQPTRDASTQGTALSLRFESASRARIRWASEHIVLEPQHPESPGWRGDPGGERGGRWVEDRGDASAMAVVEALDARVFVALLTSAGWCVTVASERRADVCAGEWLRFSGGQSLERPYRPPGEPVVLGEARLLWTEADRLVVQIPEGYHIAMRRMR